MKKNILYTLIAIIAAWFNTLPLFSQEHPYAANIVVEPIRLAQSGDSLHIDLNVTIKDFEMKSAKGINLVPVLTGPGQNLILPEISLKGTNEHIAYRRRLRSMSKKQKQEFKPPYTVIKGSRKTNKTLEYRYALPYDKWMADAVVEIHYDDCGCGQTELMHAQQLGSVSTIPAVKPVYQPIPHLAYVQPTAETVKRREIQVESFLDFIVNKTEIRPDYMNNPRELGKIHEMLDGLKMNTNISLNRIDIIGYASPEGSLANNKRLSEGRAKALRDYLAAQYEFPHSLYQTVFGGENWDGLVAALDTVEVNYKNEVLDIIERYGVDKGRKNRIMSLRGGQPYRFMVKEIYPSLRVAVCKVDYDIRSFNASEAKEIIKTRPQDLSLYEIFLVANTYEEGSPEFADVLRTAVRMFPKDEVANLNAAAMAVSQNRPVAAREYLKQVKPESYPAEYNNIMGVLAMMEKAYDAAEEYLKVAAGKGLKEAELNLQEVGKAK